ncbi:DNA-directed RNA polymerase subunit beta' [bacterium]|nr:DNA-directed RNA polymerase subunit beta' [bacterium]
MQDFSAIKLLLASPEDILSWSYGEVQTAETINYRSLKAEPAGLMCERIFGPIKDYECYCGKYRKKKYKGIVCDKCGVEIAPAKVRRERMGHIKLAVPVVHVWYAYGVPAKLAILLNIPSKKLISVIYYIRYVVTEVDKEKQAEALVEVADLLKTELEQVDNDYAERLQDLGGKLAAAKKKAESKKLADADRVEVEKEVDLLSKQNALMKKEVVDAKEEITKKYENLKALVEELHYKSVVSEESYRELAQLGTKFFTVDMGASAVEKLLGDLDLGALKTQLEDQYNTTKGAARIQVERRLKLVEGFHRNGLNPQWLVFKVVPVLPADLRPIVALAGGRFAISDVNDLYRRVINRNNRLKELMEIGAPDIILRNEKRMLQEAFDALIDNQHRFNKPVLNRMGIPYKSLTEGLRGKKGRFRRNLLGKRVDYSGRAVIIPDTNMSLEQCGLPKLLALEMFKPFVVHKMIAKGIAATIKEAKDLIEAYDSRLWDILEEVISTRTVLLNRPPTLHKYNIQAFKPILVEGSAIRINQLVGPGYNADFDGDQMSVFLVLSDEALAETKDQMLSRYNLLKVADGTPIISFAKDMVLGLYNLTTFDVQYVKDNEEEYQPYATRYDAIRAHYMGELPLRQPVRVFIDAKVGTVVTSAGRLIFNELLPDGYRFVNEIMTKKAGNNILQEIVISHTLEEAINFLDEAKRLSFKYATLSGFTMSTTDLVTSKQKKEIIEEGKQKELTIQEQYLMGMLDAKEKGRAVIKLWKDITERLSNMVWEDLTEENPLKLQVTAGANGDKSQAAQILAMQGVVTDPMGNYVQFPIIGNYAEGLNSYEYFVSARGARKGAVDTALKTAQSGYMTRKLTDVSQDVIVRMEDCGYVGEGHVVSRTDVRDMPFDKRIIGRYLAQDVTVGKKKLADAGDVVTVELAEEIDKAKVDEIWVRSPMLCKAPVGMCAKCYGYDFGLYKTVELGKAVGVIAAQSISEPMTQMTLRTFHAGGVGSDITSGIPRIVELIEAREPKFPALLASISGKVQVTEKNIIIAGEKQQRKGYVVQENDTVHVEDKKEVSLGEVIFTMGNGKEVKAPFSGEVQINGNAIYVVGTVKAQETLTIPPYGEVLVQNGDSVERGQQLTSGSVDPKVLSDLRGLYIAQKYVLDECQRVFLDYGVNLRDIHLEIITRQMTKLAKIVDAGGTGYTRGTFVNRFLADFHNEQLEKNEKKAMTYVTRLLGVTVISLNAESILASMSFQEQVKVLSEAAVVGRTDFLRGLKENVIIGRLIPVGKRAIISEIDKLEELSV